ncbi:hypothetical protein EGW08_016290 [Elysia chlorotica]|uniref:Uncharacterized protein n=1 Tax=Elysia chlorotica TaxID=188477 RepID=A0A3S0ZJ40_ELYCH|nr:hypothetical protein EGW08_016290 [Elysia chlorotica]
MTHTKNEIEENYHQKTNDDCPVFEVNTERLHKTGIRAELHRTQAYFVSSLFQMFVRISWLLIYRSVKFKDKRGGTIVRCHKKVLPTISVKSEPTQCRGCIGMEGSSWYDLFHQVYTHTIHLLFDDSSIPLKLFIRSPLILHKIYNTNRFDVTSHFDTLKKNKKPDPKSD